MRIVFGPILSRRFGVSLGVDLSPRVKQCNFNCVYCELKAAKPQDSQTQITPLQEILDSIESALQINNSIDVLTFTANGEPTLYPFLQELIKESQKILKLYPTIKTLILSNGSRFHECKEALKHFDIVKFSLDSLNPIIFKRVDKPSKSLDIEKIREGIREFAKEYTGDLIAEILIVKGINDNIESHLQSASFLREIGIKRLDLSTIDRPSSHKVFPVSNASLYKISEAFCDINVCIATRNNDKIPLQQQELDEREIVEILARRPLSHFDCEVLWTKKSLAILNSLVQKGDVVTKNIAGTMFYYITPTRSQVRF